ncbi:MAG: carboxypeptidase regulatory-like domain-containing protein [Candidatus Magnetomorum sp.]|nr:carboxypeptidase regulatory-like domain-containing protein [Candidatus Magnetomorum sp.]
MKTRMFTFIMSLTCTLLVSASFSFAAYHHMNEEDSDTFIQVYPDKKETKLDSCASCHSGGSYEKYPDSGQFISMGSCQWCHYKYGYDASGNIVETLNPYGKDFYIHGRNADAIKAIEIKDSDADGFSNIEEIRAFRYPGDAEDDPDKIVAPIRIYSKSELSQLPQHTQFMMMNTSRSGDFYAEYTGVPLEILLEDAGILDTATGVTVYAPDGWSTFHPLDPVDESSLYHIKGVYPQATYYHDPEAESWCDYSAPLCSSFSNGNIIPVSGGLKALIAIQRNGANLTPGILNAENKLDGSGPYRIVVPQKVPSAPDQSSKADNQNVIWPYNEDWDHNAGFCSRSVTIIKVEPLPEGTTDINIMEAGWKFIDEEKIIIYGAIQGQTGSVSGKLYAFNNTEKIALSGATVTIIETGHKTTSNQDGSYMIDNIPIGSYSISIKHEGHLLLIVDPIIVDESKNTQVPVCTLQLPRLTGDADNDGVIGLKDLIHWFKVLAKMID